MYELYEQFGIKELYEVAFKTTNNMRIFNQDFEKNEVLMYFDKIQISNFNTVSDHRYAEGGKNNFSLLGWDNVQSAEFQFENGLVSKNGFNLLTQSTMREAALSSFGIPKREYLISDGNGDIFLKYNIATNYSIFVYKTSGDIIVEKITGFTYLNNVVSLGLSNSYISIIVDYYFMNNECTIFDIGGDKIHGFMKMTAKIEAVDEKEGNRKTILLSIPKMQLLSNISLTIGTRANPIVGTFRVKAFSENGNSLSKFFFLNEDTEG